MNPITGKTKLFFTLADPVDYIRGTALLTEFYQSRGADAVVAPLHVRPTELDAVLKAIRLMHNVAGFGVTIPHKIAVLPLLDEVTDRARSIGAVNFVRRDAEGRLHGDNIDGLGFVAGLEAAGHEVRGLRALLVGAGGAGRAIAFALAAAGVARLQVANRSHDKAAALAAAVQAASPDCVCEATEALPDGCDLVVNATSLGMRPGDALPVPVERLSPTTIIAEVVMTPDVTPLMAQAQALGCPVVGGRAMLVGQMEAAARFAGLWG